MMLGRGEGQVTRVGMYLVQINRSERSGAISVMILLLIHLPIWRFRRGAFPCFQSFSKVNACWFSAIQVSRDYGISYRIVSCWVMVGCHGRVRREEGLPLQRTIVDRATRIKECFIRLSRDLN